jgi:hypothetical protein
MNLAAHIGVRRFVLANMRSLDTPPVSVVNAYQGELPLRRFSSEAKRVPKS